MVFLFYEKSKYKHQISNKFKIRNLNDQNKIVFSSTNKLQNNCYYGTSGSPFNYFLFRAWEIMSYIEKMLKLCLSCRTWSGIQRRKSLKPHWIPGQARNDKRAIDAVLAKTTQSSDHSPALNLSFWSLVVVCDLGSVICYFEFTWLEISEFS